MLTFLKQTVEFRHLIAAQVRAELQSSTANYRLGLLWWLLNPLFLMAIYYFLVKGVFGRGGEDYHLFLLAGLIPWQWFTYAIGSSVRTLGRNKSLILQTKFPLFTLVLVPCLTQLIFALIGMLVVLAFTGRWPDHHLLGLLPIILVQAMITLGLGCLLALVSAYLPDMERLTDFGLRALFYLSPVLYGVDMIAAWGKLPAWIIQLWQLNPLVFLLEAYRAVLIKQAWPHWPALAAWTLAGLALLQCGLLLLRHRERQVCKLV